jgi:hypothetical protein
MNSDLSPVKSHQICAVSAFIELIELTERLRKDYMYILSSVKIDRSTQCGNKISPETNNSTSKPIIVAMNTRIDRSLFLNTASTPTRNVSIPKTAARRPGMASHKLVKKPSPPLSPKKIIR